MTESQLIAFLIIASFVVIGIVFVIVHLDREAERNKNRLTQARYREQLNVMREKLELDAFTLRTYQAILRTLYQEELKKQEPSRQPEDSEFK